MNNIPQSVENDSDFEVESELPPLKEVLSEEVYRKLKPKERKRQEVINGTFIILKEKKGYSVSVHDTKSVNAQQKHKSKESELLLQFFISKSQWGLQQGTKELSISCKTAPKTHLIFFI